MKTNTVPHYDDSINTTGCCAKFNPDGWDRQELHFRDKPFLRATTRSAMHVPLNMGQVFTRVGTRMAENGAVDLDNWLILSRDLSAWQSEHLFSTDKDIPDEEMTTLSGDFITKVFEGPYNKAKDWHEQMQELVRADGKVPGRVFFFYTTCPRCAKAYGQNYIVGIAETLAA
ncbi:hydrolase [Rhodophyticola porphyridii]|uniref:hydrolase n=1 Tax=Rhodophyticola porphyridii TaxID=1852017 RepID=UPI0035D04BBE